MPGDMQLGSAYVEFGAKLDKLHEGIANAQSAVSTAMTALNNVAQFDFGGLTQSLGGAIGSAIPGVGQLQSGLKIAETTFGSITSLANAFDSQLNASRQGAADLAAKIGAIPASLREGINLLREMTDYKMPETRQEKAQEVAWAVVEKARANLKAADEDVLKKREARDAVWNDSMTKGWWYDDDMVKDINRSVRARNLAAGALDQAENLFTQIPSSVDNHPEAAIRTREAIINRNLARHAARLHEKDTRWEQDIYDEGVSRGFDMTRQDVMPEWHKGKDGRWDSERFGREMLQLNPMMDQAHVPLPPSFQSTRSSLEAFRAQMQSTISSKDANQIALERANEIAEARRKLLEQIEKNTQKADLADKLPLLG